VSAPITHERAFELIPWLVNGTLVGNERDGVELHVRNCLSCHRELKEQQRLRAALKSQPAVHISVQSGFEKLTRELGSPTLPIVTKRALPLTAFTRFAVVSAAGIALVAGLVWIVPSQRDGELPEYRTLATPPAGGNAIDLVFVQSITAAEMQQLLGEIHGTIAAGPTGVGRYTVRLDGVQDDAALEALLARLKADPRVRLAGRALAPGSGP
jgi:hypothetical protein